MKVENAPELLRRSLKNKTVSLNSPCKQNFRRALPRARPGCDPTAAERLLVELKPPAKVAEGCFNSPDKYRP